MQEARENYVTPEQFAVIEQVVVDGPFKELLRLAWDSGMRPQELVRIEARHWNSKERILVIPASEAKEQKRPRMVYVATERAAMVMDKSSGSYPSGPMLRNSEGNPWCKDSIACGFKRLRKNGIDTHLGAFRKGYCTKALQNAQSLWLALRFSRFVSR